MHLSTFILAQDEVGTGDLFKPIMSLIVGLLVLVIVIRLLRKWMGGKDDLAEVPAAGFSLASLRELVKQGKMTQEEYDKAKSQIVQATQRAAERKKPVAGVAPDLKVPPERER